MNVSIVSENPPENSPPLGFHDVDCWAVTTPDPNMPKFKFQWAIQDFLQIYNTTDKIKSPYLEVKFNGIGEIGTKWQISLRTKSSPRSGREYLSIVVHLMHIKKVSKDLPPPEFISARVRICIFESNGSIYRTTSRFPRFFHYTKSDGYGYDKFCLVDLFRKFPERLLHDGDLVLDCEMQIETPHINVEGLGGVRNEIQNNQSNSLSRLANDFRNLLHGGLASDFTIFVEANKQKKEEFHVHKVVLAARSPFFRSMFTFSDNKEKYTIIKDYDVKVVAAMLEFMYSGMVVEKEVRYWAQDLLRIADYYGVEELRNHCETVMGENVNVENAMHILVFADKFNCHSLKKVTIQFISGHRKAVMETSGFQIISVTKPHLIVDLYLS